MHRHTVKEAFLLLFLIISLVRAAGFFTCEWHHTVHAWSYTTLIKRKGFHMGVFLRHFRFQNDGYYPCSGLTDEYSILSLIWEEKNKNVLNCGKWKRFILLCLPKSKPYKLIKTIMWFLSHFCHVCMSSVYSFCLMWLIFLLFCSWPLDCHLCYSSTESQHKTFIRTMKALSSSYVVFRLNDIKVFCVSVILDN